MKRFMFILVTALVAGGVYYHEDVSAYFADAAQASSGSGGGGSFTDSMKDLGNSSNGLLGGLGNR